jgi:hypothetical protein
MVMVYVGHATEQISHVVDVGQYEVRQICAECVGVIVICLQGIVRTTHGGYGTVHGNLTFQL